MNNYSRKRVHTTQGSPGTPPPHLGSFHEIATTASQKHLAGSLPAAQPLHPTLAARRQTPWSFCRLTYGISHHKTLPLLSRVAWALFAHRPPSPLVKSPELIRAGAERSLAQGAAFLSGKQHGRWERDTGKGPSAPTTLVLPYLGVFRATAPPCPNAS